MTPNDDDGIPRAEAGHLTPEQLDDLAARASADLDPDEEEELSADLADLRHHLDGCAACRSALGDQVEVSAWLRRAPEPGPMPADVASRIDAALASAVSARSTGPAEPSTHGGTVLPMTRPPSQAGLLGRIAESRLTKSLVAAAAVVLIGAGGFAALHAKNGGGSDSTAGASSASAGGAKGSDAAPEAGGAAVQVRQSGTKYTTQNLTAEVRAQLAGVVDASRPTAAQQPLVGADATTLTSPAGLSACLKALQVATSVRPLLVDLATYNGIPAAILVLPNATDGREVWVVSRTCAPGKDGTLFFTVLR